MVKPDLLAKAPIFPMFVGVSLFVGWFIPAFYDWTGSGQSRPSPLINQAAIGLLLLGLIACSVLPWLPVSHEPPETARSGRFRFRIRTMLVATTLAALLLAVSRLVSVLAASGILYGITLCYVARVWILFRRERWQVAALLASMYFPFAWVLSFKGLSIERPEMLGIVPGLPAFFLTLLVSSLAHQHSQELIWLSVLLTSAELILGVWIIRMGPKRTIAYLLFVMITSIFGSLALNTLVRI